MAEDDGQAWLEQGILHPPLGNLDPGQLTLATERQGPQLCLVAPVEPLGPQRQLFDRLTVKCATYS